MDVRYKKGGMGRRVVTGRRTPKEWAARVPGRRVRHLVACVLMSRPTYPQVIHNIMQSAI